MTRCIALREEGEYPLCDTTGALASCQIGEHSLDEKSIEELLLATFVPIRLDADLSSSNDEDRDADANEAGAARDGRRNVVTRVGRKLRVGNLVGAFRLPSGLEIEILPKLGPSCSRDARLSLRRMWSYAMDLSIREDETSASMETTADLPIHEWLLKRFLDQLDRLVAQGLRSHYVEQDDNLLTMRGRLIVGENIRRNAFAAHRFYSRFDEFSLNRPENRLIRSALNVVVRETSSPNTRKFAAGLRERMHEIPLSNNVSADFAAWCIDRSMAHYREIRQTCEWLLHRQSSAPVGGAKEAWGRVVRMNDVFERYVTRWLSEKSHENVQVSGQGRGAYQGTKVLARTVDGNNGAPIHTMRPDIVIWNKIEREKAVAVLDVKWKEVDDRKPFSREDLYQLFAYGKHWLCANRGGVVAAIYPVLSKPGKPSTYCFPNQENLILRRIFFQIPCLSDKQEKKEWHEGIGDECLETLWTHSRSE